MARSGARVLSVVGARPQFIKAAVVSRALADRKIDEVLVHTGQHYDDAMSEVFFRELELRPPDWSLGVSGGAHGEMTGRMLIALEPVVQDVRPDLVVVYGDTNSTLAGSLVAAKLSIPSAHVEAGLRSFNRAMPEEVNRVVADHLATILLCPTRGAVGHLASEGVTRNVHHVGDVMFDAALHAAARTDPVAVASRVGLPSGEQYTVATLHRQENTATEPRLAELLDYLREFGRERPVVFPVHPRTRKAAEEYGLGFAGLLALEPLGYLDMAALVRGAALVCTDSGGLQKEAYFHGVPCVTLRDETEWVETVDAGWNRLWRQPDWQTPRRPIDDYGTGQAGHAVVRVLEDFIS